MKLIYKRLLAKSLEGMGVDRAALFADPKTYLSNQPVILTRSKSILPQLIIGLVVPGLVALTCLIFNFEWALPTVIAMVVMMALFVPSLFADQQEECVIDDLGVNFLRKRSKVHAPWSLFNQEGHSDLLTGLFIKMPANMASIEDVTQMDDKGRTLHGKAVKAPNFRLYPDEEKVGIKNVYPIKAEDMAELIRRVALTIGHQQQGA